jgi:hypothetical protein
MKKLLSGLMAAWVVLIFLPALSVANPEQAESDLPNDSQVEGPWLKLPKFDAKIDGAMFRTDPDGTLLYSRSVNGGELFVVIERVPLGEITEQKVVEAIATRESVEVGEISLDDAQELAEEHSYAYPCVTATYDIAGGARENNELLFPVGQYLFRVIFSVSANAETEYDTEEKLYKWISKIDFVGLDGAKQGGAAKPPADFAAVAFTGEGYTGASWAIAIGDYDLWYHLDPSGEEIFNLPNDSICSVRVRPGYQVTLFEHANFGGDSTTLRQDTPSLGVNNHWVSSLRAEKIAEREDDPAWKEGATVAGAFRGRLPGGKADPERIQAFAQMVESDWYGETTDDERIRMGGELLALFEDLGYSVPEWQPNTFAQQMNNFYDWRKDMNVWEIACLILNVDPKQFEK